MASMPLLDQQQGHFKEILGRGLRRCAYFLLLLEKDNEISLCLTFIGGLWLSNSAPQN